jgi:hypothetical protein
MSVMSEYVEPDVFEFSVLELMSFNETSLIWHGDVMVYFLAQR